MPKKSDDIVIKVPPYGHLIQSVIDRMHQKSSKPVTDLELKAEVYVHLNQIEKFCKAQQEKIKDEIRISGQTFDFPQYGFSLSPSPGKSLERADLVSMLEEARAIDAGENAEKDFSVEQYILRHADISKKALEEGLGKLGKVFVARFFEDAGTTAPSVTVRSLSMKRLQELITSGQAQPSYETPAYEGFDETAEPDPVNAIIAKEGVNVVPWAAPADATEGEAK